MDGYPEEMSTEERKAGRKEGCNSVQSEAGERRRDRDGSAGSAGLSARVCGVLLCVYSVVQEELYMARKCMLYTCKKRTDMYRVRLGMGTLQM